MGGEKKVNAPYPSWGYGPIPPWGYGRRKEGKRPISLLGIWAHTPMGGSKGEAPKIERRNC